MYRKLYVDECVDIVCNAVKAQSPLTLEQLCQIIQENLPGSCVPKDNLKEDARLVILDDSSFTIEYANTVPETKLLFSISFRQSTTSIGATHHMGVETSYHLINTMEKRNRLLREISERISKYPELKKVIETLGKMEMKSMNFIDLSAKMEITEEQLDDILVHNIQYFNMHEREGRVKVSLSPLCRKILNFKKKEGGCKN